MEFGLAFSFPFKDPDWIKKILIIGLVSLIPIVGPFVMMGWTLKITKNVIDHNPNALPELEFGADLKHGFMMLVIGFVYSLPLTIFGGIFAAITAFIDPNSSSGGGILIALIACFTLFALVYGILLALLLPAAYGNFAAKDSLGAAFKIGELFGLVKAAPVAYLMVILGSIIGGFIASLGIIACIVGVIFTAVYGSAISFHLYGQAYNKAIDSRRF